jgi:transcriptional regulator with XRE-family HTH domain
MNYTEFGKFFRILRIENGEVLADAKKFLGVSVSFISSVECGKKPIPEDWYKKICEHYSLSQDKSIELMNAIDRSKSSLKLDLSKSNSLRKDVALQFQRSFEEVDEETLLEIQKLLERGNKKGGF